MSDEQIFAWVADPVQPKTWMAGRWLIEYDCDQFGETWWYWLSVCETGTDLEEPVYVRLNGYYTMPDAARAAERLEFVLND